MKLSTLVLILAGCLIGFGLVSVFEPFRSDLGAYTAAAVIGGVLLAMVGLVLARRRR